MFRLISFTVLILIGTSFFSQYKISVSEKSVKFIDGNYNSFTVPIYELSKKEVEKLWKKTMKDMKANVSSKKNEMKGDDAKVKAMGENTFDIYSIAVENDDDVQLSIAFDLGGAFLSSSEHSDKAKYMKSTIYKFAVDATKEGIRGILKQEEKKQSDIQKQFDDLVKQKDKLEKDISNWEKSIEKAKGDIKENLKNQENKQKEIESQSKVVQAVKDKEKAVK